MKTRIRPILVAILFVHVYLATSQQLTVRHNDTTSLHLMVEPIGTSFGTFFGVDAGRKNVGSNNTLIGYGAGAENRTGINNTFVGEISGDANKAGGSNTYIGRAAGRLALGSDNTAIGVDAGSLNTLGNRNTFIGESAGVGSSGSDNVFLGRQAGFGATGNHKLFIENSSATSTGALLYGEFDNDYLRANGRIDVYSANSSNPGVSSVKSYNPGTFSDAPGVIGVNNVDDYWGIGVKGQGGYIGVNGLVSGTGSGSYYGFYGESNGTNPGTNYGVYGSASNATQNIGVLGIATGGTSNYAGFFQGNTYVNGNVGIGILNAGKQLHIFSGTDPTIKLQSDGVSEVSGRVSMRQSNDTGVDMYFEGVADELTFEPFNAGVGAGKKLTMNLAGNVGIGRSPGAFPLVIKGDVNNGMLQLYNNADVAKWHFRIETNGALGISESLVSDRRLVIAPGGNIGIGTTNAPSASLHIFAGTEPTIKLQSDGFSENSGRVALRQVNDTGSDLYYDGLLDLVVLETFTGGVSDGRRMIIKQTTGDVGIGTTILATGHKLSVNGKIACTEVRVQPVNQWPDYVFADDYALKPLAQLKEEIDAHNHLPGIPSAEEINNNGIQVGDMQTRMMEKIEELTLYIIELNAKMEELKKENVQQTMEIESLKKTE